MNLGLKDKIVIVTGGSKGIGEGIVRSFAAEDAITVIVNRPGKEGPALEKELTSKGKKSIFISAELNNDEDCKKVIDKTINDFNKIDVLVNNAGYNDGYGIDRSPEEFMASVHSNLFHYYALVHYALRYLIESKGNIVNIGSHVSFNGQGGTSGYAAAKGAINGLTREWAVDFLKHGIRVNCVIPGGVWTNAFKRWADKIKDPIERKKTVELISHNIPLERRFTTREELADIVVFLASVRSSHTTGEIVFPDGGYTHLDRSCT
jgi:L-fucose dehydrogenase